MPVPSGTASALFGGSRLAIPTYPAADSDTKMLRLKADRTGFEWVDTPSAAEGSAFAGGTNTGLVYVDGSGNLASDGPTWDGSTLAATGALTAGGATFSGNVATDTLTTNTGGHLVLTTTNGGAVIKPARAIEMSLTHVNALHVRNAGGGTIFNVDTSGQVVTVNGNVLPATTDTGAVGNASFRWLSGSFNSQLKVGDYEILPAAKGGEGVGLNGTGNVQHFARGTMEFFADTNNNNGVGSRFAWYINQLPTVGTGPVLEIDDAGDATFSGDVDAQGGTLKLRGDQAKYFSIISTDTDTAVQTWSSTPLTFQAGGGGAVSFGTAVTFNGGVSDLGGGTIGFGGGSGGGGMTWVKGTPNHVFQTYGGIDLGLNTTAGNDVVIGAVGLSDLIVNADAATFSGGNVGVGLTPYTQANLHVDCTWTRGVLFSNSANIGSGVSDGTYISSNASGWTLWNQESSTAGHLIFGAGNALALTIDSSQDATFSGALDVDGVATFDASGTRSMKVLAGHKLAIAATGATDKFGEISFGSSQNHTFGASGYAGNGFYWTDRTADGASQIGGSYNCVNFATAGAKLFQWQAAGVEKASIGVDGSATFSGSVGVGAAPGTERMRVQEGTNFALLVGADINAGTTLTNNVRKFARVGMPHYATATSPFSLITGDADVSNNRVIIGGGTSGGVAATDVSIYTAANNTTGTGTERFTIDSAGDATFSGALSQATGGKTFLNCTMDVGADVAYIQSMSTANSRVIVRGSLSANAGQIVVHADGHSTRPGAVRLITGGTEAINIDNSQTVTLSGDFEHEGTNFGVFSASAVAQQTAGGITAGFTAGSGTAANDDSTFTGNVGATAYTIGDVVNALKLYGLLAS